MATALIVGAGPGLSASVARQCAERGMDVALAARNIDKLEGVAAKTTAERYSCDAGDPQSVAELFARIDGPLALVVYNPSARVRGSITELDPQAVADALRITVYGGFLVAQAAAQRMLTQGYGSIFFTGASASVKGYANSATFAMGKFGLRGLAQSIARELAPRNIHVAHFVIDGGIRNRDQSAEGDQQLDPDAIARTYLNIHDQGRSAWSWEIELRPWVENF